MEDLKALVDVISRNKIKNIELIGMGQAQHQVLYNELASGNLQSEAEAENFFFPNSANKTYYFQRLKKKLNDRLINTLFFIDTNQPNFTDYQKAYYTCYKAATATKILLGKHARSPAINLAEKTIKHAIKFEFTDIILQLSKDLRFHYGTIAGNRKKYKFYNELVKTYTDLLNAELVAEEYYTQVMINFIHSNATKPEIIELTEDYSKELRTLGKDINSYWYNLIYYNINALSHELANDYTKTIEACDEALRFFDQKKHIATNNAKCLFLLRIIGAQLYLKRFDVIESYIEKCKSLIPAGSVNWFLTFHYQMIYMYHSRQFPRALETYERVISSTKKKFPSKQISEHWRIHEAFIQYFHLIGKSVLKKTTGNRKFRVSKFLNEVPSFAKDKRGNNITVIILQILFLLQQKKYGAIIDKMESLQAYTHRYLREDDTFRSNCFIKMLLCLPAASFHKKAVLRKADKYWKKLQSKPIEKANQSAELEIVPYEMLWEFVLEGLDEKWH